MNDVSIRRNGHELVIELHTCRLIADSADRVKQAMKDVIEKADTRVLIDLSRVEFIDSSGIGALVSVRKHLGEAGELGLLNPSHFVAKVLRLTRIDKAIPVIGGVSPG